jgi:parallel beta-helix repeat protein
VLSGSHVRHASYHHGESGTTEERSSERNMNITLRRALSVCVLAGIVVLCLALAMGAGSAEAKSSVIVGPGESIQKAVYAAHQGDTIVVRGVHREDVVIRKDGIELRGDDAVIEAPTGAKADSPCSRAFGTEGICVLGDVDIKTDELTGPRVKNVSVSGFTFRGFKEKGGKYGKSQVIDVYAARNATIVGNRLVGNVTSGIGATRSVGETIAKNRIIGVPETRGTGIIVQDSSRTTLVKNVVKNIPLGDRAAIAVEANSIDTTLEKNDLEDNGYGVFVADSPGTKFLSNDITDSTEVGTVILGSTGTSIVSNDIRRSGDTSIAIVGAERANNAAKVVGNRISGGPWGIFVANAHGGSFTGNRVHDNCAGMFFEAFKGEPVGGFEVSGNTLAHNTRSCQRQKFGRAFSGIGIALLGASGMQLRSNHLWGNVPSGPTRISGGVVVSKDPYYRGTEFGGTQKPKNNTVSANHFGRNKPDIFWDESGTGNRFVANLCDESVPGSLCN